MEFFPRGAPTLSGIEALDARGERLRTPTTYRPEAITLRFETDPELIAATRRSLDDADVPTPTAAAPPVNTVSLWRSGDKPLAVQRVAMWRRSRAWRWLASDAACVAGVVILIAFVHARSASALSTMKVEKQTAPVARVVLEPTPTESMPAAEITVPAVESRATHAPEPPPARALASARLPQATVPVHARSESPKESVEPPSTNVAVSPQTPEPPAAEVQRADLRDLSARAAAAIETTLE